MSFINYQEVYKEQREEYKNQILPKDKEKIITCKLFNYYKDISMSDGLQKFFQFKINLDNKKIGVFEFIVEGKLLTLNDFLIHPKYRSKGYGKKSIEMINEKISLFQKDFSVTTLYLHAHSFDKSRMNSKELSKFYNRYLKVIEDIGFEEEIHMYKELS